MRTTKNTKSAKVEYTKKNFAFFVFRPFRIFRSSHVSKGFSLIETILSITLFAIIFLAVTQVMLLEINAWAQTRIERTATEGTALVLERIAQEVRMAQAIVSSTSVFDATPGRLVLNSFTSATSSVATTVTILLNGSELDVQRSAGGTTALNATTTLSVTSTIFTRISTSTSDGVRIQITGEARRGRYVADKTLTTAVIIRRKL